MHLDPRIYAVRKDIADIELADRVFAPHYAAAEALRVIVPSVALRDGPSADARAVSQLAFGEDFAVIDNEGGWAWGYGLHDHYVGYLPFAALGEAAEPDHVVTAAAALVFAAADIKAPVVRTLPVGSRFAATAEGEFFKTADGFVHRRHAAPIADVAADPVAVAEQLIGQPYRWGGRGGDGVDCSGLVQLALAACGIAAPRDSDQQRELGSDIATGEALRRGDLVFFPGHVGLMADAETLVHANAHWMAVVREPLADVVARLSVDHEQPVIARRRILA
ncbi:Cell wall-associated hydrolase, NlpC family [Sphingomonas laterariae]|uniref:Cell wall-associated hydrolase, NlpC family n=1 Tax=Edaphosphingomonas laterariae TaxID=861865 RepID=A0A239H726_9SPHN|nr:C40 family peptidase [Sphingomonas laterariae]SNS77236.1 Cell wall-associated hydrolase, NlpC family [Sphingomonas laterariae]